MNVELQFSITPGIKTVNGRTYDESFLKILKEQVANKCALVYYGADKTTFQPSISMLFGTVESLRFNNGLLYGDVKIMNEHGSESFQELLDMERSPILSPWVIGNVDGNNVTAKEITAITLDYVGNKDGW